MLPVPLFSTSFFGLVAGFWLCCRLDLDGLDVVSLVVMFGDFVVKIGCHCFMIVDFD